MQFLQPASWAEAVEAKAAHPDAVPIAGGTDVMVGINFGHLRPSLLLDLTRVGDLQEWDTEDGAVRLGAGVSYARVIGELGDRLPGLAMASIVAAVRPASSPRSSSAAGTTAPPAARPTTRCCSPTRPTGASAT